MTGVFLQAEHAAQGHSAFLILQDQIIFIPNFFVKPLAEDSGILCGIIGDLMVCVPIGKYVFRREKGGKIVDFILLGIGKHVHTISAVVIIDDLPQVIDRGQSSRVRGAFGGEQGKIGVGRHNGAVEIPFHQQIFRQIVKIVLDGDSELIQDSFGRIVRHKARIDQRSNTEYKDDGKENPADIFFYGKGLLHLHPGHFSFLSFSFFEIRVNRSNSQ